MRLNLTLVSLLACALACSSDSSGPDTDLSGRWNANMLTAGVNTAGYSCSSTVTLDLTQNGSGLAGTYAFGGSCTTPHDRRDDDATGTITNGSVSGSAVRFDAADCSFSGTIRDGATSVAGPVTCDSQATIDVAFAGNWEATRN